MLTEKYHGIMLLVCLLCYNEGYWYALWTQPNLSLTTKLHQPTTPHHSPTSNYPTEKNPTSIMCLLTLEWYIIRFLSIILWDRCSFCLIGFFSPLNYYCVYIYLKSCQFSSALDFILSINHYLLIIFLISLFFFFFNGNNEQMWSWIVRIYSLLLNMIIYTAFVENQVRNKLFR